MKDPIENSNAATEKRILLLGLRQILREKFNNHIPGWAEHSWESWDEDKRCNVLWAILEALFNGDLVLPDPNLSSWGANETDPVTKAWMDFIFWAYGELTDKSRKWLDRSLRHYEVKNLWLLLRQNQGRQSPRTKTDT